MKALTKTDFHFNGQKSVYHGKVRDVYDINDDTSALAEAEAGSIGDYIRTIFFSALAEAIATATGAGAAAD